MIDIQWRKKSGDQLLYYINDSTLLEVSHIFQWVCRGIMVVRYVTLFLNSQTSTKLCSASNWPTQTRQEISIKNSCSLRVQTKNTKQTHSEPTDRAVSLPATPGEIDWMYSVFTKKRLC